MVDLILCHTTADFDTLGAAIGLSRLRSGARIVLAGGAHPAVRDFLALYRDEFPLLERRSVRTDLIRSIAIVDAQRRDRIAPVAEWLMLPQVEVTIYDHHVELDRDIDASDVHTAPVGATTTLITEQLQQAAIALTPIEATVMALGIHADTGSLTYDETTVRDATALVWLMQQGANVNTIAQYNTQGLSPQLQTLLAEALETAHSETIGGQTIVSVLLRTPEYVPGLSSLTSHLSELTQADAVFVAHHYCRGMKCEQGGNVLTVIVRSRIEKTDLNRLLQPFGGGGHTTAASLTLRSEDPQPILENILAAFRSQIPAPPIARDLMSSPVRTIRPDTTIDDAQRILLRYGHSGLSVVDESDRLVGVISRRDIDLALHHGFAHAPVKGYMTTTVRTIAPETTLPEIEALIVSYDVGRLPVLHEGALVGIVTRTDVLRQRLGAQKRRVAKPDNLAGLLRLDRLAEPLQKIIAIAAAQAQAQGWHLYLVGGGVRDLLLAEGDQSVTLSDLDFVVDGFHQSADAGAGVELARSLQTLYPEARLEIHGKFQTAALLWHKDPQLDSLWIDIATARTEFYPYPAANPEVEASSIRQDLYRRDFTINALAWRLTEPRAGELLDFFGGVFDLQSQRVRVLHNNSFIEDPTRIFRAVRFAVRLGFEIEPQTEGFIRYAIARIDTPLYDPSGTGRPVPALQTRLKAELKYILQAPYWKPALQKLSELGALRCIHPTLELDFGMWWQVQLVDRWLRRFDPQQTLIHWQLLLEVILARLEPEARSAVARHLQLPDESIQRLTTLQEVQERVSDELSQCDRVSAVVRSLKPYALPMLLLVGVRVPRDRRKLIWRYLTCWSTIKAPLNGNDLKQLGYPQGRQLKEILEALLAATLDGEIADRASAEDFLAERFPV